ncbi:hypothetical protein Tco_0044935 [Tanacetum coccineum]
MAGLKSSWKYGQQRPAIMVDGQEMSFRNFMYAETDEDILLAFADTWYSDNSPKKGEFVIHPGSVAGRIKERKCKTRGGSSRPLVNMRKIGSHKESSSTSSLHACESCFCEKTDSSISRDISVMRKRGKSAREEECVALRAKCKAAMTDFDNNPAVIVLREKISTLSSEAKEQKANLDRMMLESEKWAGYQVRISTLESKVVSLEAEKEKLEASEVSLCQEVENARNDRAEVVSRLYLMWGMELYNTANEAGQAFWEACVLAFVFYGGLLTKKEHTKAVPTEACSIKTSHAYYPQTLTSTPDRCLPFQVPSPSLHKVEVHRVGSGARECSQASFIKLRLCLALFGVHSTVASSPSLE